MNSINKKLDYIDNPKDTYQQYLEKALKYNVRAIFAKPNEFDLASEILADSDIIIAGAIDFPKGVMSIDQKLETFQLYSQYPYQEIDYVLNQHNIENKNFNLIHEEMLLIHDFCLEHNIREKVIVEMCKLENDTEAKLKIIEIANKIQPAFLKTSSGRSFKGAQIEDVILMKQNLSSKIKIKASGGIKTYVDALKFIQAGADVIGASAALKIIDESILFNDLETDLN